MRQETRRYAKRQLTWFRNQTPDWPRLAGIRFRRPTSTEAASVHAGARPAPARGVRMSCVLVAFRLCRPPRCWPAARRGVSAAAPAAAACAPPPPAADRPRGVVVGARSRCPRRGQDPLGGRRWTRRDARRAARLQQRRRRRRSTACGGCSRCRGCRSAAARRCSRPGTGRPTAPARRWCG